MKVYTKTGDKGTTSLVGGTRVSKTSPRLEAYGTVDELNSWIGLVATQCADATDRDTLTYIQHKLFDIGSALATEPGSRWQPAPLGTAPAERLEAEIDRLEETLPHHNRFILPGGNVAAANANIARTVARRAERRIIALTESGAPVDAEILAFVNRVSDYLFVLGRHLCVSTNTPELFWEPGV